MKSQNIHVAVRVRPALPYELQKTETLSLEAVEKDRILLQDQQMLKFDRVFGPQTTQEEIFIEMAAPIVSSFVSGYSASIMAYGQTSSGKTFTLGVPEAGLFRQFPEVKDGAGLTPRVILAFYQELQKKAKEGELIQAQVRVQYIEVYNEQLRDLLSSEEAAIQIREKIVNGYTQIYTTGANEVHVKNAKEMLSCFVNGGAARATAATALNVQSSRSHAIFTINLEQQLRSGEILKSKLNLVDLAGSERVAKTNGTGQQFKEMVGINQGLLSLGNVIKVLSEQSQAVKQNRAIKNPHVPYRDSKLTRLLQDSMGGTARCVFIACVSPSAYNYEESQITLKYAARARNIVNRPVRLVEHKTVDEDAVLKIQAENELLRECLEQMTLKQGALEQELQMARSVFQATQQLQFSQMQSSQMQASQTQQAQMQSQLQASPLAGLGSSKPDVELGAAVQVASATANQHALQNMNGTLNILLNETQAELLREQIEAMCESVEENLPFTLRAGGELLVKLQSLLFKHLVQQNVSPQHLKQMQSKIGNNQIPIKNETTRLLFMLAGFLINYLKQGAATERLLARPEREITFSDQYFTGASKPEPQLIQQILEEIGFANKIKQEVRETVGHSRFSPEDPLRFLAEDVCLAQDFVQNQRLLQQRLRQQTQAEKRLQEEIRKERESQNGVLVMDIDEDFQDVKLESEFIQNNPERHAEDEDYDFANYNFIRSHSSSQLQDEDEGQAFEEFTEQEPLDIPSAASRSRPGSSQPQASSRPGSSSQAVKQVPSAQQLQPGGFHPPPRMERKTQFNPADFQEDQPGIELVSTEYSSAPGGAAALLESISRQQRLKNPPSVGELSERLHSLEDYFGGGGRQEIEEILSRADRKSGLSSKAPSAGLPASALPVSSAPLADVEEMEYQQAVSQRQKKPKTPVQPLQSKTAQSPMNLKQSSRVGSAQLAPGVKPQPGEKSRVLSRKGSAKRQ